MAAALNLSEDYHLSAYDTLDFAPEILPPRAFLMMVDSFAISSKERELGIDSAIVLRDLPGLLDNFYSITNLKTNDTDLFLIEFDIEEYLIQNSFRYGFIGDTNKFHCDGNTYFLPITMLYISYFYFTGENIPTEMSDDDIYILRLIALSTLNFLRKKEIEFFNCHTRKKDI